MDFVVRRAYFDDYADTIEVLPPSLVQYRVRYTCPCCGYPTLLERGLDGICALCSWEDDGQDDRDADDVRHGPNKGRSLAGAREQFAAETPDAAKAAIMAAFDAMQTTPMCDHEPLWAAVLAGMEKLRPVR